MSDIRTWNTVDDSNTATPPAGFPEGMKRSDVNNSARAVMGAVRRWYDDPEWINPFNDEEDAATIAQGSTTSVTITSATNYVSGGYFPIHAYCKITDTTGPTTVYGYVATASYGGGINTITFAELTANVPAGTNRIEVYITKNLASAASSPGLDAATLGGGTRAQLQAGNRNMLLNGEFWLWQRGTTIDGTTGYFINDDTTYCADGWKLLVDESAPGDDIVDVSQDLTDAPDGFASSLKFATTGIAPSPNSEKHGIFQVLEQGRCSRLLSAAGDKVCSLQLWVKNNSGNLTKIRASIMEWRDSAAKDNPTDDPITAWGAEDVEPTYVTNWASAGTLQIASTNAWVQYKLENVTISSSAVNIGVFIHSDDEGALTTDTWSVAGVQLEQADAIGNFEYKNRDAELTEARRYFNTSIPEGTTVAQGAGHAGSLGYRCIVAGTPGGGSVDVRFNPPMVKTPTVVLHNTTSSNTNWYNVDDTADSGASATLNIGDSGFVVENPGVAGDAIGEEIRIHYHAEAKL